MNNKRFIVTQTGGPSFGEYFYAIRDTLTGLSVNAVPDLGTDKEGEDVPADADGYHELAAFLNSLCNTTPNP